MHCRSLEAIQRRQEGAVVQINVGICSDENAAVLQGGPSCSRRALANADSRGVGRGFIITYQHQDAMSNLLDVCGHYWSAARASAVVSVEVYLQLPFGF